VPSTPAAKENLMPITSARVATALLVALIVSQPIITTAIAQDASPPSPHGAAQNPDADKADTRGASSGKAQASAANADLRNLPADVTTKHTLQLTGRSLSFTATAGSIRLYTEGGEPQVDLAYTAYQQDGTDAANRPVTFLVNGGPGASSAWLQLGTAGPWRLPFDTAHAVASASPAVVANDDTWLDFSDLVFIDPVGTGYSRFIASGEDARKHFYSVDGDASALAVMIRRWLEKHDRLLSPKYLAGESYGGIRGPKIVRNLQTRQGVGVSGLLLVSPLLDFREYSGSSLLQYVASLPTFAAVARARNGAIGRGDLADVEAYARGAFITDLIRGEADREATDRAADRVAALTGIDQALSRRLAGRFGTEEFRREFDRASGKVAGRFDATLMGLDPFPDTSDSRFGDPSLDALLAPLTSATVALTRTTLKWRPDGPYHLLNGQVSGAWDFGRGRDPVESVTQLREILAGDPSLKLVVAHGLFDLATPYFGTQIALDQIPPTLTGARVRFVTYPGGHMFYSYVGPRAGLRGEVKAMIGK
jgi:carboxypeptidase C (cathepsin A)